MKAQDVAKYIINYCLEIEKPITNLQLQKILYFVQGEYYRHTKQFLIDDDFYAWQYGPVIRSVYEDYCVYGGAKIYERNNIPLNEDTKKIINPVIEKYMSKSPFQLVEESHRSGGAWQKCFDGNKSTIIPRIAIEHEYGKENSIGR